jgi:hypothetical protein
MTSGDTYHLREDDITITSANTVAEIRWPDHSTTRLGPDSRATIQKMQVAPDYSSIEIELILEKGKIWNNVVRTIYPGSYFRAKLPDNHVIAWVRWTVFEINLDKNYIHSVDHAVSLSDGLGRANTLLPGDIVEAKDIFKKLGNTILDTAWNQMNRAQDIADNILHSSQVQKSIDYLKEAWGIWDRFVRWLLSFFDGFRDIQVLESLQNIDTNKLWSIPKEYILKWYQRFQNIEFVEEREKIRTIITKTWTEWDDYIDAIARGAIWDKMSFSGLTLGSADELARRYAKTLDSSIEWVLKVVPISDLENKAKETLRTLMK